MPSRQSRQRRAQGGGRTPNSEPRLQVFKDFNGLDFGQSTRYLPIDAKDDSYSDQTDLQMNYVFLQNNVSVTRNKTLETRDDIITLFDSPEGSHFTGPVCLVGPKLYVANSDENIAYGSLDARKYVGHSYDLVSTLPIHTFVPDRFHTWTSINYYDDKLIAQTSQMRMFTADIDLFEPSGIDGELEDSPSVPNPTDPMTLTPKGSLVISNTMTDQCPFRIMVAYSYVNKFGPTKVSDNQVFYASVPVSEWHAGCYLTLSGELNNYYRIMAVEMYYATDNAMDLLFLGRVDIPDYDEELDGVVWEHNWYGYIDATSMWPIANLIAPTENYTDGVPASEACSIDGRMYFWGGPEGQRLYIGGNPGNLLSISPGTGGGFVDVEPGTGQEVRYVCKYKTQSGNSIVTMLCDSRNSRKEQRFNLVENSISLSNEQSMKSWQAEQVAGAVGCKSYHGAVVCQDGLYSVSRYGLALTTMTMEYNAQIKTTYVSDAIKPVFTDNIDFETARLANSSLLEIDGVLYLAFGDERGNLDNVLFCYDIDLKAWWTYTLDVDEKILSIFHMDYENFREGIGIVTRNHIYLLPTTVSDDEETNASHGFLIQTAQLSTQMPQQGWQYLSQLEFHFDYLIGDMDIEVRMVDMFGREIKVEKSVDEDEVLHDYVVHMRIDQRVMSYVITMSGTARFRMTHFIARVYTLSNKISQVWGFDDSISHRSAGSVHPTFKSYNDVRKAIFT